MKGEGIQNARGYVFDLDGTLLSVAVDWSAVRSRLAGLTGKGDFSPLFETLGEVLADRPGLRPRLLAVIDKFELEGEPRARLNDGSREALRLLSGRAQLALVTMQGSAFRNKVLKRFDLAQYFRVLLSREDSLDRSEQLRMAASGLGADPGDLVFIGDRLNDLASAARVGMRFVLIGKKAGATAWRFPDMEGFLEYLRGPRE